MSACPRLVLATAVFLTFFGFANLPVLVEKAIQFQHRSMPSSIRGNPTTIVKEPESTMLRRFQRRKGYSNQTGSLAFDPHAGLVDEHGHWGYVYYPTVLVRDSCRLSVSVEEQSNLCVPLKSNGTEDWEARVFGGHIQVSASSSSLTSQQHNGKVFCIHSYVRSAKQTRTIRWGKRCDGFLTVPLQRQFTKKGQSICHTMGTM